MDFLGSWHRSLNDTDARRSLFRHWRHGSMHRSLIDTGARRSLIDTGAGIGPHIAVMVPHPTSFLSLAFPKKLGGWVVPAGPETCLVVIRSPFRSYLGNIGVFDFSGRCMFRVSCVRHFWVLTRRRGNGCSATVSGARANASRLSKHQQLFYGFVT